MMHCRDAAHLLERFALLLELSGENPFKARAYSVAANVLATLDLPLDEAITSGAILSARGIGEGIRASLEELVRTGTISYLVTLERQIPPGVLQLTELRGVGAKKARQLWLDCGITSIEQLEQACREHRLASCKGFTQKTEQALLDAIAFWQSTRGYLQRHKAWQLFDATRRHLLENGAVEVLAAGELRRGIELISEVVIVAIATAPDRVALPEEFTPVGHRRYRTIATDIPIEIHLAEPATAGTVLLTATGSAEFIARLTHNTAIPLAATEEEIFHQLGLPFIPPELRDDGSIIEDAVHNGVPALVTLSDMRGMIHVHTTWSDGKHSIEEMAIAARQLGFEYIAICDHSHSAAYAGGLSIERVRQQKAEIVELNQRGLGICILHGIECDILPDGSLDYPDQVLAEFDLVVASVHSLFHLTMAEQTARMIRAIRNPYTTIVGHPTGRLLRRRESYPLDIPALIAEAAQTGTFIEFNVNPYRLDLDWRYHRLACSQGVRFAIDPDAHDIEGMAAIAEGITVARHGGLTAADVINTRSLSELLAMIAEQRQNKRRAEGVE